MIFREGSDRALRLVLSRTELLSFAFLSMVTVGALGVFTQRYVHWLSGSDARHELAAQVNRVKSYESQLMLRASALEAILEEAGELDQKYQDREAPKKAAMGGGGVGGRERQAAFTYSRPGRTNAKVDQEKNPISHLEDQMTALRMFPLGVPVQGNISSGFGRRFSPFSRRMQIHDGLDLSVDHSSSVVSVAEGVVVTAGYLGAYGRAVIIDHGNGYETLYGHLSRITVKPGKRVCRGEKIGFVGSTGRSTGPHVHYEVRRDGKAVDPSPYVELAGLLQFLS